MSRSRLALHRGAQLLAGSTLGLIFVGGLVTSTGSGLAVPDWPLSFGQFFPPMVGGIFYEHGHRMVATLVGALTVIVAAWAWRVDPRPLQRRLALAAVGVVIAQGLLGGLTVVLLLPPAVSVTHACLAQAFLCLTVLVALTTAPAWDASAGTVHLDSGARGLAIATAAAVWGQLVLGALMRHTGAGLAIPDFPLAFGRVVPPLDDWPVTIHFAHRAWAMVVAALVVTTALRLRGAAPLRAAVRLALVLVATQIALGALTIWTAKAVLPTTAHVATGAALLGTTFAIAATALHVGRPPTPRAVRAYGADRVPA